MDAMLKGRSSEEQEGPDAAKVEVQKAWIRVGPRSVGEKKKKITISLSPRSLRAVEELRSLTDADTDSEVFRNALRLHLTLTRAYLAGVRLYMKKAGAEESVPVTLFVDQELDDAEGN